MLPENLKLLLKKQQYGLVGNHSAVKVCSWTKKSLKDEGVCYKEKFYGKLHGVRSHRCLQMTPSVGWCPNRCVYCWRATNKTLADTMDGVKEDKPSEIIEQAIEQQRLLLTGMKGNEKVSRKKFEEAQNPNQAAISLTGEPTAYSGISGLIEEFRKRKFTTFLVTNGQFPERLGNISEPTQIYLSLDAPTKEIYKKIDIPRFNDFWERLNRSIEIISGMKTKKAVRLTMVKGWNDSNWKEYAKLIQNMNADFVEIKAYMHIGFSRYRLPIEAMPVHQEVQEYAKKLNEELGYDYKDEDERSRVVLLGGN